ncbi:MAG: glycosyltransferase family 2 protein [Actinomycetaceae bacterium]|jgi:rhamnosyltransferase|nr:glycosyltransferase family 2 protein [Actinomycetaceae bacterium]
MLEAVIVSYNPPDTMRSLLEALHRQCDGVVVVDNGSGPASLKVLRHICREYGSHLLELGENIGIAAAQNRGITLARSHGADFVLLSDHDSTPAPNMVVLLSEALREDPQVAAAGPLPYEEREGADELVYIDRGWAPKRATREELQQERLDVAFLIASGCLIRMEALDGVGGMREDLFIDHVDLEWGIRARRAGWRLVVVPAARLTHSLGDEVVMLPGRRQPVHVHTPVRNYYILRNTVALIRQRVLPRKWRIRYTYWALKYVAFNAFAVNRRRERQRLMLRAIRDGLRGRLGRLT